MQGNEPKPEDKAPAQVDDSAHQAGLIAELSQAVWEACRAYWARGGSRAHYGPGILEGAATLLADPAGQHRLRDICLAVNRHTAERIREIEAAYLEVVARGPK
jgi:hypothetical protein